MRLWIIAVTPKLRPLFGDLLLRVGSIGRAHIRGSLHEHELHAVQDNTFDVCQRLKPSLGILEQGQPLHCGDFNPQIGDGLLMLEGDYATTRRFQIFQVEEILF